jgi:FAD/FMN-containing dehydrogenase
MRLFLNGEAGFEEAAVGRVFNGRRPDRRPDAVLVAGSVQDVVDGVLLARERGWSVAVRSGGHAWAAWSVREGGLLIDLGELEEMTLDLKTGIATAQPATRGGDTLSPYLEARGRFFNGGHCPSVGVGGFLLQGGQGWNQRGWGWAAESVVAVDVVTADGELLRCDAEQNPDLFWAARGAGPSFPGIVVRFHLMTRPMFGFVGHTVQMYTVEDFTEVMTWLYSIHATISPDVEIVVVGLTPPDEPRTPRFLVTGVALSATREEAQAALAPFRSSPALARALVVHDGAESSLAAQRIAQEAANPRGAWYRADNAWVEGDVAEVVARIRPLFTELPTRESFTIWMSNAPTRDLPDMAFSLQTEAYVAAYVISDDPSRDPEHREWLAAAMARLEPVTAGQYLGDSDMTQRQVKFMADENFARLQRIIAERDPAGRFARYLAADPATINRNHWHLQE